MRELKNRKNIGINMDAYVKFVPIIFLVIIKIQHEQC